MESYSIKETKTHLSSLISKIEQTKEKIIIQKHGKPVAVLSPLDKKSRLHIDDALSKVVIKGDLTAPTEGEWNDI